MKTLFQILRESREAAAKSAAQHHAAAAEHKKNAGEHEEGSAGFHRAMAAHHHSLMMAHRAEANSKWQVKERIPHVKAADSHFNKSMEHHNKADKE